MFDLPNEVIGTSSPLAIRLLPRIERKILDLIAEALERWATEGFQRFNDHEESYTVVVLGRMRKIVRERELPFLVKREEVEDSQDVLDGLANPRQSPRVDLSIRHQDFSLDTYFIVECKRLARGQLTTEYVQEGMLRFKRGRYAGGMPVAAMLGYIIRDSPDELFGEINHRIENHVDFDASDLLQHATAFRTLSAVYRSSHMRPDSSTEIRLTHLLFLVPSIP